MEGRKQMKLSELTKKSTVTYCKRPNEREQMNVKTNIKDQTKGK